ncbi:MAG: hypothetical protein M1816_001802 [Peltula sp. TS41687]|nr:MAG: hypothetical protein M1816_001802 [Peltula sp. TS41687]
MESKMESHLSLAFDNLSSYDGGKIRKGLRQVEGLLAQICLSKKTNNNNNNNKPTTTAAERRRSLATTTSPGNAGAATGPKDLSALKDDAVFGEFFRLQDGFEWNVALRLITCLDRLLGKGSNGQNDLLILSTLDLIQGILLLHPPSRSLFARELYMNLLLDLLEPTNCPAIQSATLLALVCALLDQPSNTRTFESLDGLLTITSLFKQRSTSREVKLKLVEFLYFYLMPEVGVGVGVTSANSNDSTTPSTTTTAKNHDVLGLQRSPSKHTPNNGAGAGAGAGAGGARRSPEKQQQSSRTTRTTQEKQQLLGRYMSNVDALVEDLRESAPFGARVY